MAWFRQLFAVTRFSLSTLFERRGSVAASAFGIAGVVAVLVGVLSIAQGFRATLSSSSAPDVAMVLRTGATSEMMSGLSREVANIVADSAEVVRSDGGAVASPELFVVINLPKRSTGTDANVPLRGVESAAFQVRDELEIVEGRMFEWGKNEIIVGIGAEREFAGLDLGGSIEVGRNRWQVVGLFSDGGGIAESEVWTDAKVLQDAYRRGDSFQSVYAKLVGPQAFDAFKDSLSEDPRAAVKVIRQTDYFAQQSTLLYNMVTGLGYLISTLMAVGAVIGAVNTMYTAVAARTREIATLRALGFGAGPVVFSVLIESAYRAATMNWASFSQVAFKFDVSLPLLAQGVIYATLIGVVGGLFPAVRAARRPIAEALRAT